jgi:lipoprotein-releasing system ATP-binding protein
MSDKIISIKNLFKSYGKGRQKVDILQGVDFEMARGEFSAIIGRSGSGKTTLLNILGLLDSFDQGEYLFNGSDVSNFSKKDLDAFRNQEIGFIFQFHYLLKELSVFENITLPAYLKENKISKETREYAYELIEKMALQDRANYRPENLSGGEKQRVAIARALINKPSIILADEPTGNLDQETSQRVYDLFTQVIKEHNQTVLMVTHSIEMAKLTKFQYKVANYKLTKL